MPDADLLRPVVSGGSEPRTISPDALRQRLNEPDELAVLDVREIGIHARDGHILLSVPAPFSTLELRIAALVPRRRTEMRRFAHEVRPRLDRLMQVAA
jgi:hypothetical protein